MTENKKNNNLLYIALVIAGILLLLIPFFIFDLGSSINGTGHWARFGLHVLAFTGALFAGSLVSAGAAKATTSAMTMKVVAISSAAVLGTVVTINTVQYVSPRKTNQAVLTDSIASLSFTEMNDSISSSGNNNDVTNDTTTINNDRIITEPLPDENSSTPTNITIEPKKTEGNNSTTSSNKKAKEPNAIRSENTPTDKINNSNTITLNESCQSFQVLHGSKQLDRKLGLSVYDPNKTIKFNNDCGCILKEATMSLSRKNEVLEQKIQNGNFINLHAFKDLQADDKLSVEIRKATCKDNQGIQALYTFPKPILTVILISDHREFETASEIKTNKKNASNIPIDNSIKTSPKDKVEEEMNKFGN